MSLFYVSRCHDPWRNLALEEYLFLSAPKEPLLYLWLNAHTVVIGQNQNAVKECRLALLDAEGGKLARRTTGGGAVYHDLGNLNFTFIMPTGNYDISKQLDIIVHALSSFGLKAVPSGRNDLTCGGGKFSGNAFRNGSEVCMHHGTLLVNADVSNMTRYLSPSRSKLASRGVDSVRSRVINLSELADITTETLKIAVKDAFSESYGSMRELSSADFDEGTLEKLYEKHSSYRWRVGDCSLSDIHVESRFAWGDAEILASVERGLIADMKLYSDALDCDCIELISQALVKCPLTCDDIRHRIEGIEPYGREIAELLIGTI